MSIFVCRPVAYFWDRSIQGGECNDFEAGYLANASLNLIMDVVALIIPIPAVWKMKMAPEG